MKKILILGAPGSGKTFCATELSKKLSIPLHHLDFYYYNPGWKIVDPGEFAQRQRGIIRQDSWIIDGNSVKMLPERLSQADTVVFLDIPLWLRIARVLWRDCIPWRENKHLPYGCHFSWKQFFPFFTQHVLTFDRDKKQKILQIIAQYPKVNFVPIKSSRMLHDFLQSSE